MADYNFMFLILFISILVALGVSNFVQATTEHPQVGNNFFGLLYIIGALGLILYKISNP